MSAPTGDVLRPSHPRLTRLEDIMITTVHTIDHCYGSQTHCFSHNVDEPITPVYRRCFECHHVFATPEVLIAEYNEFLRILAAQPNTDPEPLPDEIAGLIDWPWDEPDTAIREINSVEQAWSCPFCLHDF